MTAQRQRSFERMYRRHAGDVYRYAFAVLRNSADAEDVTQTTFLNAYRAYAGGEEPEKPKHWLIAIAHNVCRQRFRTAARRPQETQFGDDVAAFEVDPDRLSAEDLRRALSQLTFNQRAALVLRELEGRSYDEIAETLELSHSAVETLLFRARRALREQLEDPISCRDAELALSKREDGELPWRDRGALRAHVRSCADCATLERSRRHTRRLLRGIAAVPLPASLASSFGGAAGAGAGVATAKATAVAAVGIVLGAGTFVGSARSVKEERAAHPVVAGVVGLRAPARETRAAAAVLDVPVTSVSRPVRARLVAFRSETAKAAEPERARAPRKAKNAEKAKKPQKAKKRGKAKPRTALRGGLPPAARVLAVPVRAGKPAARPPARVTPLRHGPKRTLRGRPQGRARHGILKR